MKNKDLIQVIIACLLGISIIFVTTFSKKQGWKDGYMKGFEDGVTIALDSVNVIATQQLNNKSISSKFLIQTTDTLEVILSPKTIKMK